MKNLKNNNQSKYICDDRPIKISTRLAKMTDEEIEQEYQRKFGKNEKKVEQKFKETFEQKLS